MTDQLSDTAGAASEVEEAAEAGLVPQLSIMTRALVASPVLFKLLLLGTAIFIVIVFTAYEQIRLNSWNQPFYNALSSKNLSSFADQLGIFVQIVAALLVLNVAQKWLTEMTKVKLREGLVRDLVMEWLKPHRAFRLANAGPMGVNPDQRMHEDARHLTELSTDLGVGLLQSSILLVSFVSVLWDLSSGFQLRFARYVFNIPGYMVWAAVIYAGSASLLSYVAGRRLVAQNAARYGQEAELRFTLMRVNEHIDAISLAGGEADEERRVDTSLQGVLAAMKRLVGSLTGLTWITAGYGWFTLVAPILVAAPIYFTSNLSFGGLMMAAGAFNQVQTSLRWFVDNFSTIADWRATLLRVASFRSAVLATDVLHQTESRVRFDEGAAGLTLENLEIASPAGCNKLREKDVSVSSGEHILIVGEPGTEKTRFFQALAGLWPWGSGRVAWPKGDYVIHLPHVPYLPPGTLRDVLAYPAKVETFDDTSFAEALRRMGLERHVSALDVEKRWNRELDTDEQQAVAFARALLHKPDWLLIDGALDSLEEETRQRLMESLRTDFDRAGVIYIGRADTKDRFFSRVLHLTSDPKARALRRGHTPIHLRTEGPRVVEPAS